MSITIHISPDLKEQLREEAKKVGLDVSHLISKILEEQFPASNKPVTELSESELLTQINLGISNDIWKAFNELTEKRKAENLTDDEQAELIYYSDLIEAANARRMPYLLALAQQRGQSLDQLIQSLGLHSAQNG